MLDLASLQFALVASQEPTRYPELVEDRCMAIEPARMCLIVRLSEAEKPFRVELRRIEDCRDDEQAIRLIVCGDGE